jgi:glycosyltransferase involved in cell wall biosynthesis
VSRAITVVVPCFDQATYVPEAIASIRAQRRRDWELIVVDDGSGDDSSAAAEDAAGGDARVRVVRTGNHGVAAARNRGASLASPESRFLLFLDADDALAATALERFAAVLERHPTAGLAHCALALIDERGDALPDTPSFRPRWARGGRVLAQRLRPDEPVTPLESVLGLAPLIPSAMLLRRSTFDAVGGWDTTFGQGFEDTDLVLRIAMVSELRYLPERLVRHRRHGFQSSAVAGRHEAQIEQLHRRWRDTGGRTPEQRRRLEDAWRFHDGPLRRSLTLQILRRQLRERRYREMARVAGGHVRAQLRRR